MRKRISDMTPKEKADFLEATKKEMLRLHGIPWEKVEPIIQADLDAAFDDEKFPKMDPEHRIDAAYARKEFEDKKPSLVDYLLWHLKFATNSDEVEW